MTGEIRYNFYTLTGTKELEIKYTLTPGIGSEPGIGEITVKSDDPPDIDDDAMQEIIDLCMEDAKKHGLEEEKPDLALACAGYPFSVN